MKPQKMPVAAGDVCWDVPYVDEMLSPIAHVGAAHVDWFLATHSPIMCSSPTGLLSEGEVFQRLFNSASAELLVVIKGEPGAGKSQLINWLRLRFDDALARGDKPPHRAGQLRTVMIKRRSGSLKDSLQQLVEQLPGYERHLADVTKAISELSSEQARRRLSFFISEALLADQATAPRQLKKLHELFHDMRCMDWMCRPGGAIDKNILRLTTESDPESRESLPPFRSEEFLIRDRRGMAVDALLLDTLEDESAMREQAAAEVSRHLRQAIAELTGLRGQTLHEVFRNIRLDLQRRGEYLALFVEDVSTLSVLDEELVNALEPQGDPELCGLLSVLGMTVPAHDRLPDNLKQRIDLDLELKGDRSGASLASDADYADRFAARYLNALRAGPQEVLRLAHDQRRDGELSQSACDGCRLRKDCFNAFGAVSFGEARVGLYPLASGAASRLLNGLNAPQAARNPRGLLQKVIRPLLDAAGRNFSREGGSVGLEIAPVSPSDIDAKRERLLGGWPIEQQSRLSYLNWYWAGASSLEEGAGFLQSMLPWFGLKKFSAAVPLPPSPPPTTPAPPNPTPGTPPPVQPPAEQIPVGYMKAGQRLDAWFQQGQPLALDKELRDLLVKAIKQSLPIDTYRSPSYGQRIRSMPIDASNIRIEDMVSRPVVATKARFVFMRNEESYLLLRALLDFEYRGRSSWNFPGAESHRRTYARWLRERQDELVRSYHVVRTDPLEVQDVAVRFLLMAYRFCERKALPSDTSAAVSQLTSFAADEPHVLSDAGRRLSGDVKDRVERIRQFLFTELSIPQGTGGGVNYIDPTVILRTMAEHASPLSLPALQGDQAEADFPEVWRLSRSPWKDLTEGLEAEHVALLGRLEDLRRVLRKWDIDTESLTEGLREFFVSARAVVKACAASGHSIGDTELQQKIANLAPAEVTRQIAPVAAAEATEQAGPITILSLDVAPLVRLVEFVLVVNGSIGRLAETLEAKLVGVVTQAELDLERARAGQALTQLASLAESEDASSSADAVEVANDQE